MVGQQKRVQVAKYSAQRDTYAASLPSATAATVCRCVAERPRLAGGGRWLVVASSGVLPPPSAETRYSRKHATGIGSNTPISLLPDHRITGTKRARAATAGRAASPPRTANDVTETRRG